MEWAVAMEIRADNPCDRTGPALGAQNYEVKRMRALPHTEVASAIGKVRASNSKPVVKLAFEFLVLTAARDGEVRSVEWTEIDLEGPFRLRSTKTNREHRVPLTPRCADGSSLSRSTIYVRLHPGRFPRPVALGARSAG